MARFSTKMFLSLASSRLSVERLILFNSDRMQRCSLACNELSHIASSTAKLSPLLTGIRVVSLSLSDSVIVESDKDAASSDDLVEPYDYARCPVARREEDMLLEASDDANFRGFLPFPRSCPQLEDSNPNRFLLCHSPDLSTIQFKGILAAIGNVQLE